MHTTEEIPNSNGIIMSSLFSSGSLTPRMIFENKLNLKIKAHLHSMKFYEFAVKKSSSTYGMSLTRIMNACKKISKFKFV